MNLEDQYRQKEKVWQKRETLNICLYNIKQPYPHT